MKMENNLNDAIASQIENVNKALKWINDNQHDDYRGKFMELVEQRRILKKVYEANCENPAMAAFGVSQVGKSYLMGCLLKKDGKRFILKCNGKEYDFLKEMNPQTVSSTEATGVVTRFTSFLRYPDRYSEDYPILMRCLSLADIATIISDSYYNDVKDYKAWSDSVLRKESEKLVAKYKDSAPLRNPRLTPDDVLEMKEYHKKYLNNAQVLLEAGFFDDLAFIADRIPETELAETLSIIWVNCEPFTRLLVRLMETMSKFGYSRYVYLSEDALIHNSDNENTLMSVECLNKLFDEKPKYHTDAYLREGDVFTKIPHLTKSEVGAVCSEIIVKIGDEYLDNASTYNLSFISDPEVKRELQNGRPTRQDSITGDELVDVPMDILRKNDLLDFPGARGRDQYSIQDLELKAEALMKTYLRGKVAYLFNEYSSSRLINILFYCHHASQHDVNNMPDLLKDWIMRYVGDTMAERAKTINKTGISPFFYIATKFNMDMKWQDGTNANSANDIKNRWKERFEKVLYHHCFKVDTSLDKEKVEFYKNWTSTGEKFGNSYLLRDFKFSEGDHLFKGEKTPERKCLMEETHPGYYEDLKNTFIKSDKVEAFFPNRVLSWEAAATVDNDGATLILDRLTTVASKIESTRNYQFTEALNKCTKKVIEAISNYVVSTDVDEIMEKNVRNARSIYREMSFTCNQDNHYFGHLIQALQLTEPTAYQIIHKVINDPKLIGKPQDFKDYEIIVKDLANNGFPLDTLQTIESQWHALCVTYGFEDQEEAETYLNAKQVDSEKLFSGSFKRKKYSCILADAVFDHWKERIKSASLLNETTGNQDFDVSTMNILTDSLVKSAISLHLYDEMAESIGEFVNTVDIHSVKPNFLADILSSKINSFVLDFGYSLLGEKTLEKARKICTEKKLPVYKYIDKPRLEIKELDQMSDLFDNMIDNGQSLLPSFEDTYNSWLEYMFVSFISHLDVPEGFDREANARLVQLLSKIKKNEVINVES